MQSLPLRSAYAARDGAATLYEQVRAQQQGESWQGHLAAPAVWLPDEAVEPFETPPTHPRRRSRNQSGPIIERPSDADGHSHADVGERLPVPVDPENLGWRAVGHREHRGAAPFDALERNGVVRGVWRSPFPPAGDAPGSMPVTEERGCPFSGAVPAPQEEERLIGARGRGGEPIDQLHAGDAAGLEPRTVPEESGRNHDPNAIGHGKIGPPEGPVKRAIMAGRNDVFRIERHDMAAFRVWFDQRSGDPPLDPDRVDQVERRTEEIDSRGWGAS